MQRSGAIGATLALPRDGAQRARAAAQLKLVPYHKAGIIPLARLMTRAGVLPIRIACAIPSAGQSLDPLIPIACPDGRHLGVDETPHHGHV